MKLQLIDGWHRFYTMYSMWAFVLLGIAPDVYNLAVQYNLVTGGNAPAALARMINMMAFAGAVARLVKQKKLEAEAVQTTESKTTTK